MSTRNHSTPDGDHTVIVGEETIAALRSGEMVILDNVILLPASDLVRVADRCTNPKTKGARA